MSLGGLGAVGGIGIGIYYGIVLRNRNNSYENKGNDSKVIYGNPVTVNNRTTGGGIVYTGTNDSQNNSKKVESNSTKEV